MYWQLFQFAVLSFVPLFPVNATIHRPDPTKNLWTLECEGFETYPSVLKKIFLKAKLFYTDTVAAQQLKSE
jgi:hypothetical protein